MVKTTIGISNKVKDGLDKIKVHPNQSYEEVVINLVRFWVLNYDKLTEENCEKE